ncbi:MAG: N-acetyltransferase [Peptococcaceae bacterium]|nr:N-acetyltransferase [Peptococcaceae bacterium]
MLLRKATMADVESIRALINNYADQGLMLPKARSAIYENIREYVLAEEAGQVVGVGGLHILWHDLAEVRSLAVAEGVRGKGIGRKIVSALEEEARTLGVTRCFALTYQKDFFSSCGYQLVENKELPQKVWTECINCPKFPDCDEYAMVKEV